jgi:hypothetical protein
MSYLAFSSAALFRRSSSSSSRLDFWCISAGYFGTFQEILCVRVWSEAVCVSEPVFHVRVDTKRPHASSWHSVLAR